MRYRVGTLLIVLLCVPCTAVTGQEKRELAAALYGEWRIVEMVYNRVHEVIPVEAGPGSFFFEPGKFVYALDKEARDKVVQDKRLRNALTERFAVREREIDIWTKYLARKSEELVTVRYELREDRLKVLWPASLGDGPADFDEAYKDRNYTLYVLEKVK